MQKLNAIGYRVQPYVDDLMTVVVDNYPNMITDLMQSSLKVVDSWCKTKGLSENPEKTKIIVLKYLHSNV